MAIHFECPNPGCGETLSSPSRLAGQRVRCKFCGLVITVPDLPDEAEEGTRVDRDVLAGLAGQEDQDAGPPGRRRVAPFPVPAPRPSVRRPGAGRSSALTPLAAAVVDRPTGSFATDCLASIGYASKCLGAVLGMAGALMLLAVAVSLLVGALDWATADAFTQELGRFVSTSTGAVTTVAAVLLVVFVIHGYFLRFFLDVAERTAAGSDEPPQWLAARGRGKFALGLLGVGMQIVFVLPLAGLIYVVQVMITRGGGFRSVVAALLLMLLTWLLVPVGALGLSVYRDLRALNLGWALWVVVKRPGRLAVIWVAALLHLVVGVVVVLAARAIFGAIAAEIGPETAGARFLVGLVMLIETGLVITLALTFAVVLFRMGGLLGRYNGDVLAPLARAGQGAGLAYVAGCLVAAIVVVVAARPPRGAFQEMVALVFRAGPADALSPRRAEADPESARHLRGPKRGRAAKGPGVAPPAAGNVEARSVERLKVLGQAVQRYANLNEGDFPPALTELVEFKLVGARGIRSGAGRDQDYAYLPGQDYRCDKTNVLAYSPVDFASGRRAALLADGSVLCLHGSKILKRVAETRQRIEHRRRAGPTPKPEHILLLYAIRKLRALKTALRLYAEENGGRFPPSLETLVQQGKVHAKTIRSTVDPSRLFAYVPGQTNRSGKTNVLVYSPADYGSGRRVALKVSGGVLTHYGDGVVAVDRATVVGLKAHRAGTASRPGPARP